MHTHNEKHNGGAMPPGHSSRDDRCGVVRVAAERHVCDGNIGSGLLGRISEAWPALAPPGGYFPSRKFLVEFP